MIDNATVVVNQPLPVVEAMVRDVSGWAALFCEVEDVGRLARDRYVVQLRRGRRVLPAVIRVQRQAHEHRVAWHTVTGPAWAGELHLVALTGRRTAVHLTFVRSRTRPRGPVLGGGASLENLRGRLRRLLPGFGRRVPGGRILIGQARRDLHRLRERVDALPRPVRPHRLGPLPGTRPVHDVLIVDGLRAEPGARAAGEVPSGAGVDARQGAAPGD